LVAGGITIKNKTKKTTKITPLTMNAERKADTELPDEGFESAILFAENLCAERATFVEKWTTAATMGQGAPADRGELFYVEPG
jgi:hypothetical protein